MPRPIVVPSTSIATSTVIEAATVVDMLDAQGAQRLGDHHPEATHS